MPWMVFDTNKMAGRPLLREELSRAEAEHEADLYRRHVSLKSSSSRKQM